MNEDKKKAAAKEALKYIKSNNIIGIGTGSTVKPFIELLNNLVENEGLKISCVPTSKESKESLHKNIKILDETLTQTIDLSIDGADIVSEDFYLIKGGGGALLREKFVALNSLVNITIVDDSKVTKELFNHPLPIEIVPFGYASTLKRLKDSGFAGSLRMKDGNLFITDNYNYIFDIDLNFPIKDPESMHKSLKSLTGVIETGLFLRTSSIIIIGKNEDSVDVWDRGKQNERKNT